MSYRIFIAQHYKFFFRREIIMSGFEILCGLAALLLAFYYYSTSTFNFWKSRGVQGPKPVFLFGNTIDLMLARISMVDYLQNLYKVYKNEPMVGLYMRRSPVLVLNDLELIKDVMIRDFSTFADRGFAVHERVCYIAFVSEKMSDKKLIATPCSLSIFLIRSYDLLIVRSRSKQIFLS